MATRSPTRGVHEIVTVALWPQAAVLLALLSCTAPDGEPPGKRADSESRPTDSGDTGTSGSPEVQIHGTCGRWAGVADPYSCSVWTVLNDGSEGPTPTLLSPATASLVDGTLAWTPTEEEAGTQTLAIQAAASSAEWTVEVAADRLVEEAYASEDGSLSLSGEVGGVGFSSFTLDLPAGAVPRGGLVQVYERTHPAHARPGAPMLFVRTAAGAPEAGALSLVLPIETWTAMGFVEEAKPTAVLPAGDRWTAWEAQTWDPETRTLTIEVESDGAMRLLSEVGWAVSATVLAFSGEYRDGTLVERDGTVIYDGNVWLPSVEEFQDGDRNCLIVHGIMSEYSNFLAADDVGPWADWHCEHLQFFDYGFAHGVDDVARMLHTAVHANPSQSGEVYVFAHSNGGLVTRWLAQELGQADLPARVSTLVTLDSPHEGALTSSFEVWLADVGVELAMAPSGITDLVDDDPGSVLDTLADHGKLSGSYCIAAVDTREDGESDGIVTKSSSLANCEPASSATFTFTGGDDDVFYAVHNFVHEQYVSSGESGTVEAWLGWTDEPTPTEDCWAADDGDGDGLAGCDDDDCWSHDACSVELTGISPNSAVQNTEISVTISGQNFRSDGSSPRLYAGEGIEVTGAAWMDEETLTASLSVTCDAPVGVVMLEYAQPDETGESCASNGRACEDLFEVLEEPGCGFDDDGDGVSSVEDCDDDDAMTYPGATERCDLVDNDCDGVVDPACAGPTYHSGTLSADETWAEADGPHVLSGTVVVAEGVTLTIEAGADVWAYGSALQVCGGLDAVGTGADHVRFTSTGSPAAPGDWSGISLESGSTASLVGATIEYASTGITVGSEVDPEITDCTITDFLSAGVYLAYGRPAAGDDPSRFARNTITGGDAQPVVAWFDRAHRVDSSNALTGNAVDEVYVYASTASGVLEDDTTLQALDVPWKLGWYVANVDAALTVESGAAVETETSILVGYYYAGSLALESGATLAVAGRVAVYSGSDLTAEGTFTSAESAPAPGDWSGISLESGSTATIDGASVSYANVGVSIQSSSTSLTNSTISNCLTYGVEVAADVTPTITGMTYSGNPEDVHYD